METEIITWYPGHNKPRAFDKHILAELFGTIYSGVYENKHNKFIFDQIDFEPEDWSHVKKWCYYPTR